MGPGPPTKTVNFYNMERNFRIVYAGISSPRLTRRRMATRHLLEDSLVGISFKYRSEQVQTTVIWFTIKLKLNGLETLKEDELHRWSRSCGKAFEHTAVSVLRERFGEHLWAVSSTVTFFNFCELNYLQIISFK